MALKPSPASKEKSPTASEAFATIASGATTIAREQMVAARLENFDRADGNGDSTLSAAEKKLFAAYVRIRPDDSAPKL